MWWLFKEEGENFAGCPLPSRFFVSTPFSGVFATMESGHIPSGNVLLSGLFEVVGVFCQSETYLVLQLLNLRETLTLRRHSGRVPLSSLSSS